MLQAIKPYGNSSEQDIIEFLCGFLGTGKPNEPVSAMSGEPEISVKNRKSPLEQLKGFLLSPEQPSPYGNHADAGTDHAAIYIIFSDTINLSQKGIFIL